MPYITKKLRGQFDIIIDNLPDIDSKGNLEYCIFKLMKKFMETKEYRYKDLHDCTYAAAHCADEFRRLYLDPREDVARAENGDIE